MNDKLKKTIDFFGTPWRIIIGIGVVVSLFVGLQNFDGYFAKTTQLNAMAATIEKDTKNKLLLVEAESVKTFQGLQMQQMIIHKSSLLQMYQIRKEFLDKEHSRLKREQRRYPNDIDIKEELEYNKHERLIIQQKINEKIEE